MTGRPSDGPAGRVIAVDARSLARPGIGFYVVVAGLVAELTEKGWALVLVTDEAEQAYNLRRAHAQAEVVYLPRTTWLWWEQVQVARSSPPLIAQPALQQQGFQQQQQIRGHAYALVQPDRGASIAGEEGMTIVVLCVLL